MMQQLRVVLCLAAFLFSAPALAQQLWQATRVGMTPAEVQAVLPRATPPLDKPEILNDSELEMLRLEREPIGSVNFLVRFFFKDGRLGSVLLTMDPPGGFDRGYPAFNTVLEGLRIRYGKETEFGSGRRGMLRRDEAMWLVGHTRITLTLMSAGPDSSLLNLAYQGAANAAAGRL